MLASAPSAEGGNGIIDGDAVLRGATSVGIAASTEPRRESPDMALRKAAEIAYDLQQGAAIAGIGVTRGITGPSVLNVQSLAKEIEADPSIYDEHIATKAKNTKIALGLAMAAHAGVGAVGAAGRLLGASGQGALAVAEATARAAAIPGMIVAMDKATPDASGPMNRLQAGTAARTAEQNLNDNTLAATTQKQIDLALATYEAEKRDIEARKTPDRPSAIGRYGQNFAEQFGPVAVSTGKALGGLNPLAMYEYWQSQGAGAKKAESLMAHRGRLGELPPEEIAGIMLDAERSGDVYAAIEFMTQPISAIKGLGIPVGGSIAKAAVAYWERALPNSPAGRAAIRAVTELMGSTVGETVEEGLQKDTDLTFENKIRTRLNALDPKQKEELYRWTDRFKAGFKEMADTLPYMVGFAGVGTAINLPGIIGDERESGKAREQVEKVRMERESSLRKHGATDAEIAAFNKAWKSDDLDGTESVFADVFGRAYKDATAQAAAPAIAQDQPAAAEPSTPAAKESKRLREHEEARFDRTLTAAGLTKEQYDQAAADTQTRKEYLAQANGDPVTAAKLWLDDQRVQPAAQPGQQEAAGVPQGAGIGETAPTPATKPATGATATITPPAEAAPPTTKGGPNAQEMQGPRGSAVAEPAKGPDAVLSPPAAPAPPRPIVPGLTYAGIQETPGLPDAEVWTDSETGGTFHMPIGSTEADLIQKRDESRKKFDDAAEKKTSAVRKLRVMALGKAIGQVSTFQEASQRWAVLRQKMMEDGSGPDDIGTVTLQDEAGATVGRVAWNGRVFTPDGKQLLYENQKNPIAPVTLAPEAKADATPETAPAAAETKPPELMAPDEFNAEWDAGSIKHPLVNRKTFHRSRIDQAMERKQPVSADAVDAYEMDIDVGYVREGGRYVFKGEQAATKTASAAPQEDRTPPLPAQNALAKGQDGATIPAQNAPKLFLYSNPSSGRMAWAEDAPSARKLAKLPPPAVMVRVVNKGQALPDGYERTGQGLAGDPIQYVQKKTTPVDLTKKTQAEQDAEKPSLIPTGTASPSRYSSMTDNEVSVLSTQGKTSAIKIAARAEMERRKAAQAAETPAASAAVKVAEQPSGDVTVSVPSENEDRLRMLREAAKVGITIDEAVEQAIAKLDNGWTLATTAEALQYGQQKPAIDQLRENAALDPKKTGLGDRANAILSAMGQTIKSRAQPDMSQKAIASAPSFTISDAKYAKGKKVVRLENDAHDGMKGRLARLADAVGGRYVGRYRGYQMTPDQAVRFGRLANAGWDAQYRFVAGKPAEFMHPNHPGKTFALMPAVQMASRLTAEDALKSKALDRTAELRREAAKRQDAEPASPVTAAQADAKTPDPAIEAGEELTRNRRNIVAKRREWGDFSDMNDALKAREVVKANVWPKPDYQALIDAGMQPAVAHVVKQAYDAVAAKPNTRAAPTDADFRLYVEAVNRIHDGVLAWANDRDAVLGWLNKSVQMGQALSGRGGMIEIAALAAQPSKKMLDFIYPNGWKALREEVIVAGANRLLRGLQPDYDSAKRATDAIDKGWPGKREAWQVQGYRILSGDDFTVEYYERPDDERGPYVSANLYAKMDNRSRTVGGEIIRGAKSKNDAAVREWAAKNFDTLKGKRVLLNNRRDIVGAFDNDEDAAEAAREATKRGKSGGISDKGISVEQAERVGPERRLEGQDISADDLIKTFGFKGVNFGNWMKTPSARAEAQLHLNHAYDAMLDLSEIMGVPAKAMSLNGLLGLAVGAQGHGGMAAAHFVPGVNEINLTRTGGAGSLAHEWAHAMDHYFAVQAGLATRSEPFLTEHALYAERKTMAQEGGKYVPKTERLADAGIRPEIIAAFASIVNQMNERAMTAEELAGQEQAARESAEKNRDRWIASIRRDFAGQEEAFDKLAARMKTGDLGDGKIAVSRSMYLSPVMVELRDLYKSKHGRLYSADNSKGLQSWLDSNVYRAAKKDADASHVPQKVSTDYAKNAFKLDQDKGGKKYWSTNLEKFARAFDAFISDALDAQAAKNTYLSHAGRSGDTVPTGTERTAINAAFDALVKTIKTRETDKGVAMYAKGDGSTLRGEFWLRGGKATSASGQDEANHEAVVMQQAAQDVARALRDAGSSDLADIIIRNAGDPTATRTEINDWTDSQDDADTLNNMGHAEIILHRAKNEVSERIVRSLVEGSDFDARTVGMREYEWVRVHGNNVQTEVLTSDRLRSIARGLRDAYGDAVDGEVFNIEVNGTKAFYTDVPWDVITGGDVAALRPFKDRAGFAQGEMLAGQPAGVTLAQFDSALADETASLSFAGENVTAFERYEDADELVKAIVERGDGQAAKTSANPIVQKAVELVRVGDSVDKFVVLQSDVSVRPDAKQSWTVLIGRNIEANGDINDLLESASLTDGLMADGIRGVDATVWQRPEDVTVEIHGYNAEDIEALISDAMRYDGSDKSNQSSGWKRTDHGGDYGTTFVAGPRGRLFNSTIKAKYLSLSESEQAKSAARKIIQGLPAYGSGVLYDIDNANTEDQSSTDQPRFFRNDDGTVRAVTMGLRSWFFLDRYANESQLRADIREEAGHRLVNEMAGREWSGPLGIGHRTYQGKWADIVQEIERNYGFARGTPEFNHELLAKALRDSKQDVSIWRRLLDAVVAWLKRNARRLGLRTDLSDAEIRNYLNGWLRAKVAGDAVRSSAMAGQPYYAKSSASGQKDPERKRTVAEMKAWLAAVEKRIPLAPAVAGVQAAVTASAVDAQAVARDVRLRAGAQERVNKARAKAGLPPLPADKLPTTGVGVEAAMRMIGREEGAAAGRMLGARDSVLMSMRELARTTGTKYVEWVINAADVAAQYQLAIDAETDPKAKVAAARMAARGVLGAEAASRLGETVKGDWLSAWGVLDAQITKTMNRYYGRGIKKLYAYARRHKLRPGYAEDFAAIKDANPVSGLSKLSAVQAKKIYQQLKGILTQSRNEGKMLGKMRAGERGQELMEMEREVEASADPMNKEQTQRNRGLAKHRLLDYQAMPWVRAMQVFGGKDSTGYGLFYEGLRRGSTAALSLRERVLDEFYEKAKARGWDEEKLIQAKTDRKEVDFHYFRFNMTTAQRIMLLWTMLDSDAYAKLINNGWLPSDLGKQSSKAARLQPEDMALALMIFEVGATEDERNLAKDLRDAMTDLGEAANPAAVMLMGHDVYTSDSYAPIRTELSGKNRNISDALKNVYEAMLEDMGINIERVQHKNPLLILNAFDVFEEHADKMSRMAHLAVPIRNTMMVLGTGEKDLNTHEAGLMEKIRQRWGTDFENNTIEMLRKLAGLKDQESTKPQSMAVRMARGAAASILSWRPTTIIKNRIGGSLVAAGYMAGEYGPAMAAEFLADSLSGVSLTKAEHDGIVKELMANGFLRARWKKDLIRSFTATAEERSETQTKWQLELRKHQQNGLVPMAQAELRNAIAMYRTAIRRGMSKDQALELAEKVTRNTQNPSDALDESAMFIYVRNSAFSIIYPFIGQPMVARNLIHGAAVQAAHAKTATEKSHAYMAILFAALGLAANEAVNEWIRTGLAALRTRGTGDDDEEKTWRFRVQSIVANMADMLVPGIGSMVVDVLSSLSSGGQYRPQSLQLSAIYTALRGVTRIASAKEEAAYLKGAFDLVEGVFTAVGAPYVGGVMQVGRVALGPAMMTNAAHRQGAIRTQINSLPKDPSGPQMHAAFIAALTQARKDGSITVLGENGKKIPPQEQVQRFRSSFRSMLERERGKQAAKRYSAYLEDK